MDRRGVLTMGAGLAMLPATARAATQEIVVDPRRLPGTVGTIAEALAMAGGAATIRLAPGVFVEKLTITTPGVTIEGSGPGSVISYGAYAGLRKPDGSNTGTSGSATRSSSTPVPSTAPTRTRSRSSTWRRSRRERCGYEQSPRCPRGSHVGQTRSVAGAGASILLLAKHGAPDLRFCRELH